ncbi:MAG: hypothetical protein AAFN74_22215, partial [Myxococcota bacterium]
LLVTYLVAPFLHDLVVEHASGPDFGPTARAHVDRCEHGPHLEDVDDPLERTRKERLNTSAWTTLEQGCSCLHTHHACLASLMLRGASPTPSQLVVPVASFENRQRFRPAWHVRRIGHWLAPKTSPPSAFIS